MIIKNADVYTQDNVFVKGDVVVDNGTFTKVLEAPDYVAVSYTHLTLPTN